IAVNRKARHEYHLLERFEAGIVLTGTEVKSLREGKATIERAYADVRDGQVWLIGAHIAPYEQASIGSHDPDRDRKLPLPRKDIRGRPGFDVVGSPAELQAEVPGRPRKTTGNQRKCG